jgi:hypothetical protein
MRAAQDEIGLGVIEGALVQLHDLRPASAVVGVAGAAELRLEPPVEPSMAAHVQADLLMALEAQRVLRLALEGHVAVAALALGPGMRLDQRAGREHALQRLGKRRRAGEREPGREEAADVQ